MKLKPKTYNKSQTLHNDEKTFVFESGLIAQEIWYEIPCK